MLKLKVGGPRVLGGSRRTYALVASQYNPKFVQGSGGSRRHRIDAFGSQRPPHFASGSRGVRNSHRDPGVSHQAEDNEIDALIALGVIIEGDTSHAELLASSVTHALQQIMLLTRIPVIHQVLTCKDEAQAKIRCLETPYNRGTEAAHTAINIASLLAQLRA